jgi:two-component system chemotaxis response regulator CheY
MFWFRLFCEDFMTVVKKVKEFHVLLVDDDVTFLDTLEELVFDELSTSARILRATDGSEALKKISNQVFDLIITDNNMPKIEGLDLVKILRDDGLNGGERKDIPVIFISGNLHDFQVSDALGLGVTNILVKPIDPERFKKSLRQILKIAN